MKKSRVLWIALLTVVLSLTLVSAQDVVESAIAESNRDTLALGPQAFNDADWDLFKSIVTDDFVLNQPLSPEPIVSEDALMGFFQSFHVAMPDISHPNVNLLMANDEWAVVLMPLSGTFENESMGVPPNGEKVIAYVLNFWHFNEELMDYAYFNFDSLDLLTQMGAVPVMPGAPEINRMDDPMPLEIGEGDAAVSEAVVRGFFEELINTGDLGLVPDYFTEDWVLHNRADVHDVSYEGHEGVAEWGNSFYAMMPDFAIDMDESNTWFVANGDFVAARWTGVGTHTGDVPGIPASGNELVITGAGIYRVEDGKIAETWFIVDTLGMMAQIGLAGDA
jgi:steroid delta-isomerase-like uncharacterized protein